MANQKMEKSEADAEPAILLCESIRDYLEYVRVGKRLAERTIILYEQDLIRLQKAAQDAGLTVLALQPVHIRRQVAQMHSQGRSGRGIALILSGWRGFYHWAVRQGLVMVNPVIDVRAPKSPRPLPKALAADDAVQLAQFREAAPTASASGVVNMQEAQWLELRDAAMTELFYSSGLRVAELIGLDWRASAQGNSAGRGWVDWQAAEVHVVGKGDKSRTVPVGAPAMQALQAWREVRILHAAIDEADAAALFIGRRGQRLTAQNVWLRLRQRSQKAGLGTPVHPHMLRHSFASHVLQSSGDLRAVQELLGHANISTTQVYTRLDFQHLAKIYDAAHPRAHLRSQIPKEGDAPSSDDEAD